MFLRVKDFLILVFLSTLVSLSAFAGGTQTFRLFKNNKRIGSMELTSRERSSGFETTARTYFGAGQSSIQCNVDEKWNLVSVSVQESLAHKVFRRIEVKSHGKRISIETVDAKDKKVRSEFSVRDLVIPKTALYHYFSTIKNPEVNVPHEIQIFDELSLTLRDETWTYLGPRINGKRKVAHDFELKGDENMIFILSDKKKLRRVQDLKAKTEIRARNARKK